MAVVKLEDARRVISAAETRAKEVGQPMNIAVVDEGGNIVAHVRMDDAWIGSIDVSMKKGLHRRGHLILRQRSWQSTLNQEASSSVFMRPTTAK